jgi:hypothetical protein
LFKKTKTFWGFESRVKKGLGTSFEGGEES